MHVNLLPPALVWSRLIRKRFRQWVCALGFLAVAFVGGNVTLFGQWWVDLREFQTMHAAAAPIRQLQVDRLALAKRSFALKQKINQLQSTVARDRTTSLLGIIAVGVGASNGEVQIQEMQVSLEVESSEAIVNPRETQAKSASKSAMLVVSKSAENKYHMTLRGIAMKSESISTFMDSLQASNVFPKVELRSSQEKVIADRSLQEFQLECFGND
jgi:hypothetical protein